MTKITYDQAKKFLENINHNDKVAIIHDADTDGFSSGIIYYEWCKRKKAKTAHFAFVRLVASIKDFDLRDCNKVIITDIAQNMIHEEMKFLDGKEVLYCDHHQQKDETIPKNVLTYNPYQEGYFPSSRIAYKFTNLKPLFGLAGMLGDAADLYKENDEMLKDLTEKLNTNIQEFREHISGIINCMIILSQKNKKLSEAFEELAKVESLEEIKKLEEKTKPVSEEIQFHLREFFNKKESLGLVDYYFFDPKYDIKGTVATIITMKLHKHPCIFATPLDKDNIGLSARDQARNINVADILKKGMEGFTNCTSGGHPYAAGGKVMKVDLEKFKKNIKNFKI